MTPSANFLAGFSCSLALLFLSSACDGDKDPAPEGAVESQDLEAGGPASDTNQESNSANAKPRFIAPYVACEGEVCTTVDVSGTTKLGLDYPAALCPDVRNIGRPYYPRAVPVIDSAAMRPEDPQFAHELGWVTKEIRSGACTCCHDTSKDGRAASWDIAIPGPWVDQLTDRGVVIMAGRLESTAFGTTKGVDINGFNRELTGASTTDGVRMRAFFDAELDRRGVTEADIAMMQKEEDAAEAARAARR